MDALAWFSTLCTLICLLCCGVALATLRSLRAFVSSRPQKRLSDLEVSQAELASSLESLTTTLRRLSAKTGMQALRAKRAADAPPTNKQEARERYLYGKSHTEVARMHLNGVQPPTEE